MGVVGTFAFGVVLTMYRHPFLRFHARGQPQPESEEMADHRVQIERPVGLVAVKKDRYRSDADMGQRQHHHRVTPGG